MELFFGIDVVDSSNFLHKRPVTISSIKPRALHPAINKHRVFSSLLRLITLNGLLCDYEHSE